MGVKLGESRIIPATCRFIGEEAEICFIVPFMPKRESLPVSLVGCDCVPSMRSEKTGRGVDIFLRGKKYTEYCTGTDIAKPYLGPFFDGFGTQLTRLDFETKEHRHHRSLWISHGSVNDVDTWNEAEGTHGFERSMELRDFVNGCAYTAFTAVNRWTDFNGNPLLDETTRYTLYNTPDEAVLLDVEISLKASYGPVTLGRTKEAGVLAIRMAENLKVKNTGTMISGTGGVNESEIWMKRAPWMDYYGTENGHVCGIAVLDNPKNENFPTYWHSRDYGLMAPNNFFIPGPRALAREETICWLYRVIFHSGDTAAADIASKFADFAFPAVVTG